MRASSILFAVAVALPLMSPVVAQAPAPFDLDTVEPLTGSWVYRAIANGSEADFIDSGSIERMAIRCNRASRIVSVVRTGVAAAAPTLSIWTSASSRSVPSRYDSTKMLTADLSATDRLLDSIAFSRGRFATAAAGAPLLTVPAWPETARVVEDCRS